MQSKRVGKKSGKKRASVGKKAQGRPSSYTETLAKRVTNGLAQGTPLTIICQADDMPCDDTVRNWADADPAFSRAIARAREAGFDRIAMDALEIADNIGHEDRDTITFEKGGVPIEIPDKEWILRSKLRVDTRLKLLSKWDPKRYGDKVTQEISGPDGKAIKTAHEIPQELQDAMLERAAEASAIAATVQAPASFRGEGSEE